VRGARDEGGLHWVSLRTLKSPQEGIGSVLCKDPSVDVWLSYIQKFFDTLPFKRRSLIPPQDVC
jgi:hypothetical protein